MEANNLSVHAPDASLNPSAPFPPSVAQQLLPVHRSLALFEHEETSWQKGHSLAALDSNRAPSPRDIFGGLWKFVRWPSFPLQKNAALEQLRRQVLVQLFLPNHASASSASFKVDEWKVRQAMVEGLNPTLHGIPVAKLAVLLAVIGRAPRETDLFSSASGPGVD